MASRTITLPFGTLSVDSFPAPTSELTLVETHLSWVILTGVRAYKFKKPVALGFVDCRSLSQRKRLCQRELEINSVYAPDVYLGVRPVTRDGDMLCVGGTGRPVDYAVEMVQFTTENLVSQRLEEGRFSAEQVRCLGRTIAGWHRHLRPLPPSEAPQISDVQRSFHRAVRALTDLVPHARLAGLQRMSEWGNRFLTQNEARFASRAADGFVRECHGDLHLDNLVIDGDEFFAFDAIEFDDELRRIDTAVDIAFPVMDFSARGRPDLGRELLGSYLEATGDYDCLGLMRFAVLSRAIVRALVTLLRTSDSNRFDRAWQYLEVAMQAVTGQALHLAITHGVSGSGKTTAARRYCAETGSIWIRSDVERHRVATRPDDSQLRDAGQASDYSEAAIAATYQRLYSLAERALRDGWPVIVDATFLNKRRRDDFRLLANQLGIPFTIVDCHVSPSVAAERIAQRQHDASEADAAVLERQLHSADPLTAAERVYRCCTKFDHCQSPTACPVPNQWEIDESASCGEAIACTDRSCELAVECSTSETKESSRPSCE